MFSQSNSYDYKRYYKNILNTLPFTGTYELTDGYKCIQIYVKTTKNDTLHIDFTNNKDDTGNEITENYNINNDETEFIIHTKLKYFRIRITTATTFSSSDKRMYNVSLSLIQMLGTDENGHIVVSTTIEGFIIDHTESSIRVYDSSGASITVDTSGNLKTNKLLKSTDSVSIYDSSGASINVDSSGNLKTSKIAKSTDSISIYDSSGASITVDSSGNLKTSKIAKSTDSISIYDSSGASINVDTSGNLKTTISNTITTSFSPTSYDAFGRMRISNPYTLFDSKNVGKQNGKFTYCVSGTGQIPSYNSNTSTVGLTCNAGTGLVINESKCRFVYQPGKSLLIMTTFCFGSVTVGTPNTSIATQRVGYFDDDNGIYVEINPTGVFINKRSAIAGLTESIAIAGWNGDASLKTTLNFSKSQIFWIDLEWLGVGTVRTGFIINGTYYVAHSFHHANSITTTYMTSAQLPVRYQINSTGTGAICTLTQICSTVISEGGYEGNSINRHVGTDTSGTLISNISTLNIDIPCCAIRIGTDPSGSILNSADSSGTIYNSIIVPSQMSIYINTTLGSSNNTQSIVEYKLILNPTITYKVGYSWKKYTSLYTADTSSTVEYLLQTDFSGNGINGAVSAISGGIIINTGFIETRSAYGFNSPHDFNYQLGRIIDSYTTLTKYRSDVLVVALRLVYLGQVTVTNAAVKIGWYEL
jgi:hypothetical protein